MSAAWVLVCVALLFLVLLAYLTAGRRGHAANADQALTALRSLDIEAFRNLVNPEEDQFLEARLAPEEFRKMIRERRRAALAYVKALSAASLEFARLGDAARKNPDPAIAESGRQISNSATYLRFRAVQATANLTVALAFPGVGARPVRSLLEQYDRAAHLLQNHNGLQRARSQAS